MKCDVVVLHVSHTLYSRSMSMKFNDGDTVRILDQSGNVCAEGIYRGTGIPARELNARHPTFQHYAVIVEGEVRYYPTGFHSLIPAKR
jgi:hypothetical protein